MDNSTILFLMGALLVAFVLLRKSQRRGPLAKLPPVSPPRHAGHPPAGHHLDAPGTMARWEVEMYELARDLAGQLDSKIVIVEHLVADAQRAADRLDAAIQRAEQIGLWQRSSGQVDDDRLADPSATETIHAKPVHDWPGRGGSDLPQPDPAGEQAAARRAAVALVGRADSVYRLADRGLSSAAIAAELGEPLGEVELILSLRPAANTD